MTISPYGWQHSLPEQPPHRLGMYSDSFPGAGAIPTPRVSPARRIVARWIDWTVIMLLTSPLWLITWFYIKHEAVKHAAESTEVGFAQLLFGRWGAVDDSIMSRLSEFWGVVVLWMVGTFVVQVLIVAGYDVILHRWCGRTLGKAMLSLRVVPAEPGVRVGFAGATRRIGPGRVACRTALTVVLPGAAWAMLLAAVLWLDLLLLLGSALLFALSGTECLAFRGSSWGRTCWHDRRTCTAVVSQKWLTSLRYLGEINHHPHVTGGLPFPRRTFPPPGAVK